MRLPDFLVIGAMKAGTTTLYRDLLTQPSIYFPEVKEPGLLDNDHVLTDEGRAEYAQLFATAQLDQRCGEASTTSTKLPDIPGVPQRARQVIGDHTKLIYLLRNPIERAISHHVHAALREEVPFDFAEAFASHPELLNYSRYAMQADAWLKEFPRQNMHIVVFEEYVVDRQRIAKECLDFLGADCLDINRVDPDRVYNATYDTVWTNKGMLGSLNRNSFYRRIVRPLIPLDARQKIRRLLRRELPRKPSPPSEEMMFHLRDELSSECEEVARLLGRESSPWDLDQTISKLQTRA